MARDVIIDKDEVDAEARTTGGLGSALIIVTTLLLLGAFFTMQLALDKHFGAGLFGS